jgi:hypothetical protein
VRGVACHLGCQSIGASALHWARTRCGLRSTRCGLSGACSRLVGACGGLSCAGGGLSCCCDRFNLACDIVIYHVYSSVIGPVEGHIQSHPLNGYIDLNHCDLCLSWIGCTGCHLIPTCSKLHCACCKVSCACCKVSCACGGLSCACGGLSCACGGLSCACYWLRSTRCGLLNRQVIAHRVGDGRAGLIHVLSNRAGTAGSAYSIT